MADDEQQQQQPEVEPPTSVVTEEKKQRRGLMSKMWNGIFRGGRKDDFEKKLQFITKSEASVLARMKNRSVSWRRAARNLIVFSVILEVIAISYAVMTTRSLHLDWQMRALRVLPMFLLPGVSTLVYTALMSFNKMRDRKDQETLERLRTERLDKINELKEKSNYYGMLKLIQTYDSDPNARAAAATVLASKLGTDSGIKVYVADESNRSPQSGKSTEAEYPQSKGLRNRKHNRAASAGNSEMDSIEETSPQEFGFNAGGPRSPVQNQALVVDHHPSSTVHDGGWVARVAALLVGEDPTQSYALICGNCHRHNGLARKEDFAYITYYCPHCNALNKSKQLEDHTEAVPGSTKSSSSGTPNSTDAGESIVGRKLSPTNSDVIAAVIAGTTSGSEEDEISKEMVN